MPKYSRGTFDRNTSVEAHFWSMGRYLWERRGERGRVLFGAEVGYGFGYFPMMHAESTAVDLDTYG